MQGRDREIHQGNMEVVMDKIQNMVDSFMYLNYRYNRERSPDITPVSWKLIYGEKVSLYEMWFQIDRNILPSAEL